MSRFIVIILLLNVFNSSGQTQTECDTLIQKSVLEWQTAKYTSALKKLNEVEKLALQNQWSDQLYQCFAEKGNIFLTIEDYDNAIQYYTKAYSLAIRNKNRKNEILVLSNLGVLYAQNGNLDKSKQYMQKVLFLAEKYKFEKNACSVSNNLSMLNLQMGNIPLAVYYHNKSMQLFNLKNNNIRNFIAIKITQASIKLQQGKIDEAIYIADSIQKTKWLKTSDYKLINADLNTFLSYCYYLKKDYEKSISLGLNVLSEKDLSKSKKLKALNHLKMYYTGLKLFDKALMYSDSINLLSDSISEARNAELYNMLKIRFELAEMENNNNRFLERVAFERIKLISVLFFVLVLSLLLFLYFRKKIRFKNKEQELLTSRHKILALELNLKHKESEILKRQNSEIESLLKIKELTLENEVKEKLITQKRLKEQEDAVKIYALETEKEKKNRLLIEQLLKEKEMMALLEIEKLKEEINKFDLKLSEKIAVQQGRNYAIEEIINTLLSDKYIKSSPSLTNQINRLKFQINEDQKWEEYVKRQENTSRFIDKIKETHKNLTVSDLRYLSYILLKLDVKEMANLLSISPEGIRKRKERILKKLNLNPGDDLYNYLKSI